MTLARRAAIVLPVAAVAVLLGLTLASQDVAAAFHYPRAFGPGWFDAGGARVYAPWSFALWYLRFGGAYPRAFDLAALIALAVVLAPAMAGIALTRQHPARAAQVRRGRVGRARRCPKGQTPPAGARDQRPGAGTLRGPISHL